MLCPNCKNKRDRQEPVVVRGVAVEVCSICVERILWNVREAPPDATIDTAVVLADSLIDGSAQEIWRVTESGRHRHGRPRKEVLDVLFVGLVAAMIGEGVDATLGRIEPTRLSGPISPRTVTRGLAAPEFLPVLRIAYAGSIDLAAHVSRSPQAIVVGHALEPAALAEQLNAILKVPSGGWKTPAGRLAKLLCMATGHNLKLFDAHVESGEPDGKVPPKPAEPPDEPIPAIMLL
jgi:hypothetical protein